MQFQDLPPEIIQVIFNFLSLEWLGYLKNSPDWIHPFAFRAYYRNISHFDVYDAPAPPDDDPYYERILDDIETPFEINYASYVNFRSFDELTRFFDKHRRFSPRNMAFLETQSLIAFSKVHMNVLQGAERVILCTLDRILDREMRSLFRIPHLYLRAWWKEKSETDLFPVTEVGADRFSEVAEKLGRVEVDYVPNSMGRFPSLSFVAGRLQLLEIQKLNLPDFLTYIEFKDWEITDNENIVDLQSFSNIRNIGFKNGEHFSFDNVKFPLGIEMLRFHKCNMSKFSSFPHFENLETLTIEYGTSSPFCYEFFNCTRLPETLRKLIVRIGFTYNDDAEFILEHHECFDSNSNFILGKTFVLPRKLAVFQLDCYGHIVISDTWKMPDTITSLALLNVAEIKQPDRLHLPTSLRELVLESLCLTSLEGISFPKSIESLHLDNMYLPIESAETCNILELPDLKILEISRFEKTKCSVNNWLLHEANFQHLPNLRRIELSEISLECSLNIKTPRYLEELNLANSQVDFISPLFEVPRYLRKLLVCCRLFAPEILRCLPSCLEDLSIKAIEAGELRRPLKYFPRIRRINLEFPINQITLTNMHLERLSTVTKLILRTNMTSINVGCLSPGVELLTLDSPLVSLIGDFQTMTELKCLSFNSCNPEQIHKHSNQLLSFGPSLRSLSFKNCAGERFKLIKFPTCLTSILVDFVKKPNIDDIIEMCEFYIQHERTHIELNFTDPRLAVYDSKWVQTYNVAHQVSIQ